MWTERVRASRWSLLCLALAFLSMKAYSQDPATPAPGVVVVYDEAKELVDVSEKGVPVLRYHHGATEVPEGTEAWYKRGGYISRLHGLDGEIITEDYPADHPHHRAVSWSWATIEWNGKTADMFWGKGAWTRPVRMVRAEGGAKKGVIEADCVWKWNDETAIVREHVLIEIGAANEMGRIIDITLSFTPIVDGLRFCGRLEAAYSGFTARMAPGEQQEILLHTDDEDIQPRRAWADYSALFPNVSERSGLAIIQHTSDPLYPQEWREYARLNFFQPLYPGGELIAMPKDETITLRYRLWVHRGPANEANLNALWDDYNDARGTDSE